MFAARYFPSRYFARRYWPAVGAALPEAGYNVYKRLLPDAESVFVAFVPAGTEEYVATGFSAGSEQWFFVKAVSRCDVEDDEPIRLRRVAFDSLGNLILAVPNAPIGLSLECGAAGAITASFSYITNNQEAEPVRFNVYVATGSSAFNFASPTAQVTYTQRYRYSASLGTFADLTTMRVIVRAEAAGPAEEKNLNEVTAIADAAAPDPALALEVEVTAS